MGYLQIFLVLIWEFLLPYEFDSLNNSLYLLDLEALPATKIVRLGILFHIPFYPKYRYAYLHADMTTLSITLQFKSRAEMHKNEKKVNVVATDSLAALSTDLEMDSADKFGMKRAKSFSEGLRKVARIVSNNGWIIACSNQVREGQFGEVTPGGKAFPFYSSLRIRINQVGKIEKEIEEGVKIKKATGIISSCYCQKSTIDDPYRECKIYIRFGYGIDDVMGNLQYIKTYTGDSVYNCCGQKTYKAIEKAIVYIEQNNLQDKLKENVIDLWNKIENRFKLNRQPKVR